MRTLTLQLEFEPKATEPAGEPPSFTVSSGDGVVTVLAGDAADAAGPAHYETSVQVTGETSFDESGTMVLGGRTFALTTVGEGNLVPSPIEPWLQGTVVWRLSESGGDATGTVSSNFLADLGAGLGNERQLVRLFLP